MVKARIRNVSVADALGVELQYTRCIPRLDTAAAIAFDPVEPGPLPRTRHVTIADDTRTGALPEPRPDPDQVRDELQRVLASPYFASAGRGREFLRYAVEETLAGRGDRLKGYTIAVDVFGRSAAFNASTDPLVRVEARRVRRRLAEYYSTVGRENPVRIDLPLGGYVAAFALTPRSARPRGQRRPTPRRRALWIGNAVAAALATVAIGISLWPRSDPPGSAGASRPTVVDLGAPGTPVPRIAVTAFANLSGSTDLDDFVTGMTEETMIQLSRFGVPVTLRHALLGSGQTGASDEPHIAYLLTGSVRREAELIRISPRLLDAASGAQVWTASFDERLGPDERMSIQERVATRVAATLTNPFGPMYTHEIAKIAALPVEQLDSYGCILQFRAYTRSLERGAHDRSRRCFLRVVTEDPQRAYLWAGLSLIHQHELWYDYYPQTDPGDSLHRAREAARNALDIDGQNLLANIAMAGALYSAGELESFATIAERAIALSKNPGARAQMGFLMTLSGNSEHGRVLLERAFAADAEIPSWYYLGYSFDEMLRGNHAQALSWALRADSPHWFAVPLTMAAAAGLAGRTDIARRSIARLLEVEPEFSRTGHERLERWIRDPRLIEQIAAGLAAGGLELCRDCPPGDLLRQREAP